VKKEINNKEGLPMYVFKKRKGINIILLMCVRFGFDK
jgi:hypothetical protein